LALFIFSAVEEVESRKKNVSRKKLINKSSPVACVKSNKRRVKGRAVILLSEIGRRKVSPQKDWPLIDRRRNERGEKFFE
jgi:hypothetical protein